MLHCAVKGLETDPPVMSSLVRLLISLGTPLSLARSRALCLSRSLTLLLSLPPPTTTHSFGVRRPISPGRSLSLSICLSFSLPRPPLFLDAS